MKILNLYSGIGGNRKLWGDEHQITAVESNPSIAKVYKQFFPQDEVLAGVDAHTYLELVAPSANFDFIWSSPPCQTHSRLNSAMRNIRYADMSLWQEIILLERLGKMTGLKWVVENVIPYYKSLIPPRISIGRHLFWSNLENNSGVLDIPDDNLAYVLDIHRLHEKDLSDYTIPELLDFHGFKDFELERGDKRQVLRNCTHHKIGKCLFNLVLNSVGAYAPLFEEAK